MSSLNHGNRLINLQQLSYVGIYGSKIAHVRIWVYLYLFGHAKFKSSLIGVAVWAINYIMLALPDLFVQ